MTSNFSRRPPSKVIERHAQASHPSSFSPCGNAGAFFWVWYAAGLMSVKLARSAGLISLATMASRVLGVAREMVLAAFFGAGSGYEMDAYNVAFRIPNLVRDLFAEVMCQPSVSS